MVQTFLRKLRHGAGLTETDEHIVTSLAQPLRRFGARRDITEEGAEPRSLPLIVEGWACRYRDLENGKRQIISLFVPGDLCEPFGALPRFMEHSLGALTPVVLAPFSVKALRDVARTHAQIEEALWWDLLFASAVERERVVSLGRRSASERMGHLFCELHLRLEMVGLSEGRSYEMPLTQADLADLFGLSTVHVNRALQDLRRSGMISLRGGNLSIHRLDELRDYSLFDPAYLQTSVGSYAEPTGMADR